MWQELLLAVHPSLPSAPTQSWPLIRLNICDNHSILNTFVLIQALLIPKPSLCQNKDCSQLLQAKITCFCAEASGSASHLLPGRKRPFKLCDITWGAVSLLSWADLMVIVDDVFNVLSSKFWSIHFISTLYLLDRHISSNYVNWCTVWVLNTVIPYSNHNVLASEFPVFSCLLFELTEMFNSLILYFLSINFLLQSSFPLLSF